MQRRTISRDSFFFLAGLATGFFLVLAGRPARTQETPPRPMARPPQPRLLSIETPLTLAQKFFDPARRAENSQFTIPPPDYSQPQRVPKYLLVMRVWMFDFDSPQSRVEDPESYGWLYRARLFEDKAELIKTVREEGGEVIGAWRLSDENKIHILREGEV